MKQRYTKKTNKRRLFTRIGLVIAALVIITLILELTSVIHFLDKDTPKPTSGSQYTKGEQNSGDSASSKDSQTTQGEREGDTFTDTKGQSDEPVTPSKEIKAVSGNFVSAHKFSLSEAPLLQSSCETTPKITCQIFFVKGSTTLKLEAKTTDDGGAAYWTWKPGDIGLTTGAWKVQAKATSGSNSLSADDALPLEVTP
ncbi:MAG TPA: hypothetical protein VFT16_02050 [Candidatus Saccharimonadales bacterium]|nr:hypothetical protein [Candidatus Saccharimonadales bacterium]